jgi:hypothetical protein
VFLRTCGRIPVSQHKQVHVRPQLQFPKCMRVSGVCSFPRCACKVHQDRGCCAPCLACVPLRSSQQTLAAPLLTKSCIPSHTNKHAGTHRMLDSLEANARNACACHVLYIPCVAGVMSVGCGSPAQQATCRPGTIYVWGVVILVGNIRLLHAPQHSSLRSVLQQLITACPFHSLYVCLLAWSLVRTGSTGLGASACSIPPFSAHQCM